MLVMTVEFHEVRVRMQDVVDAVQQGREVVVTHFGKPFGMFFMHGPPGKPPRAWVESAVRKGFEEMAADMCRYGVLPSPFLFLN